MSSTSATAESTQLHHQSFDRVPDGVHPPTPRNNPQNERQQKQQEQQVMSTPLLREEILAEDNDGDVQEVSNDVGWAQGNAAPPPPPPPLPETSPSEIEQLLCMVEVQRQHLQRDLADQYQKHESERNAFELERRKLRADMAALEHALVQTDRDCTILKEENAELLDALSTMETQVHAVQLEVTASRAVTPATAEFQQKQTAAAGNHRFSRRSSIANSNPDLGGTHASLSLGESMAATPPRSAMPNPLEGGDDDDDVENATIDGESTILNSTTSASSREQKLLSVIEQSSLVFSDIQAKVYTLQLELDTANKEIDRLKAEKEPLEEQAQVAEGANHLLKDAIDETNLLKMLNLFDSEKYARVFLHCQFEVTAYQHWAILQHNVRMQQQKDSESRVEGLENGIAHMGKQLEQELRNAQHLNEKMRQAEREAATQEVLEKTEEYRNEIQNLRINNDLLQKNLDEWRNQHNTGLQQKDEALQVVERTLEKEREANRSSILLKDQEVKGAVEMKEVLKEQITKLEADLQTQKKTIEGHGLVMNELQSKVRRAEYNRMAAIKEWKHAERYVQALEAQADKLGLPRIVLPKDDTFGGEYSSPNSHHHHRLSSSQEDASSFGVIPDNNMEYDGTPMSPFDKNGGKRSSFNSPQNGSSSFTDPMMVIQSGGLDAKPSVKIDPPPFMKQSSSMLSSPNTQSLKSPPKSPRHSGNNNGLGSAVPPLLQQQLDYADQRYTATTSSSHAASTMQGQRKRSNTVSPGAEANDLSSSPSGGGRPRATTTVDNHRHQREQHNEQLLVEYQRRIAGLEQQQAQLEQVVVAVEKEKLQRWAQFKSETDQLRYLADAADRTRGEAERELKRLEEELRVARAENSKLQAKLATHERTLQEKDIVLAAATQAEREAHKQLSKLSDHGNAEREDMEALIIELETNVTDMSSKLRRAKLERDDMYNGVSGLWEAAIDAQIKQLIAEERLGRREIIHNSQIYFMQRSQLMDAMAPSSS